ncbi:sensor histidine kinase [Moheibacter sediminis]|nr:hypothetical protein [Moheibacter sediminis]
MKNYLQKTILLIDNNDMDSAEISATQLQILSKNTYNHYYSGKVNSILGYLNLIKKNEDSAYLYYSISKNHFLEINDSINTSKVLGNMAIIQSNQGDYSGSEITAINALKFIKDYENQPFKSSIFNCLAISSSNLDNHDESIYWLKKSIESTDDKYSKSLYLNNLSVSHLYLKDYTNSIRILSNLLNDSIVLNNPDLKSKVIDNLAYSKWKQNPKLNLENELNNALEIRIENDDKWGQIASNAHLSEYFSDKNPTSALFYSREMYRLATELKSPDDRLEALQKLISFESPQNSKKYAIQYASLNDSLVKTRNQSKDKFAKIRYDSEKNREENEILRAETAEQQLEIERRKLYGVLFASGIVLICGGFIAFQRIQRIKNQKRINDEIHATENKIAGKVHDDIANNVYGLMSFIEINNDSFNTEKHNLVMEKLDEIYNLSRNISRENSPIETGEKYPDELLGLFSNYKSDKRNVVLIGFEENPWVNVKSEPKIQFYKIIQELLTNMKKHSKASLVVLKFEFNENKLNFFYTDNGIGFIENQPNTKNGIRITENRIEKIKGTISFVSEPNKGLKVNISIPI